VVINGNNFLFIKRGGISNFSFGGTLKETFTRVLAVGVKSKGEKKPGVLKKRLAEILHLGNRWEKCV